MNPRPLPDAAQRLCDKLDAPPRLIAHLRLVHDIAAELLDALSERFPDLPMDRDSVLFGAATHDIGKVVHPNELTGPGNLHEAAGAALLEEHHVPSHLARFARTHGTWDQKDVTIAIEDLLVALADSVWKGTRHSELESCLVARIVAGSSTEPWHAFSVLDEILQGIAADAEQRLAWQSANAM